MIPVSFASFAFARRTRTLSVAATTAACVASLVASASCILADPPPELPKPPKHHPIIVKGSVAPPYTQKLSELPPTFVVPVELIDPDTTFAWNVFVDFDPTTNQQPVNGRTLTPNPADVDGGVTPVDFSLSPLDPSICHEIQMVVALSFAPTSQHTPDSNGADSIVWFYEPPGCAAWDGGGDGAFPDQDSGLFVPNDVGGQ